ncbi:hypothetical protein [Sporomusa sphaeroides]|uniref:hypothetical protein n=1 Tax=Sporomusa sphaeroides TaxID=47679 RepID=UPI002BBEBE90|nr:hypothetical protein [Sporomusa sphaeroides]HML33833.1 hypothetical protein [Sporomusa sphaeroides]
MSECKYPDKCPITNEPLFMELEHPDLGWVPTYGGPYDSYTIPEIDDDGDFVRYRYDHDEGCWVDGTDMVGNATDIITDLRDKLNKANHIGKTALEDVMRLLQERDDLRAKLEAAEKAKNELIDDLILERRKSSGHSSESMYFMQQAGKLEQDRDNLQAQLQAAKISIKDREARAEYSADCAVKPANELKGMTEARDTFYNDMLLYKKSCDDLIKFRDEQFDKIDKLTAENTSLQTRLAVIESKIRKAFQDTNKIPPFLPNPKEKHIDEVVDRLAYRSDQFWTIVGIIANYPTLQKENEDISDTVKRLVELLDMTKRDNDSLLNQLAYMQETMTQIQDIIKNYKEIHEIEIGNIVHQALSTTPEQDGERVRNNEKCIDCDNYHDKTVDLLNCKVKDDVVMCCTGACNNFTKEINVIGCACNVNAKPVEAGERVRGLVISEIESCDNCKWNDPGNEHCEMCSPFLSEWSSDHKLVREIIDAAFDIAMKYDDYSMPDYSEPDAVNNARKRLYNALTKYRGGADNE